MRKTTAAVVSISVLALGLPAIAQAHPERGTSFPSIGGFPPPPGGVPKYRSKGPSIVVCKPQSARLLRSEFKHYKRLLARRLKQLKRCRFHDIQPAVNAAKSSYRILIMPGTYQEMASRMTPVGSYGSGPCATDYVVTEGFSNAPPPIGPRSNDPPVRPNRNFQTKCPNSKNLIEVVGDPSHEKDPLHPSIPTCTQKCNLQIEGMGRTPAGVLIQGDRKKLDVLRVDRASGIYLTNFTVEQSAFNDVDLVEVNGFRVSKVVARYAQDYGVLSFTATNGLMDHDVAYGNGDSGLYPGSTEKGCQTDPNSYGTCAMVDGVDPLTGNRGCDFYSIEIRNSESYDNTLGYSGTAGNSTYVHDNNFHDNASGLSTDSFAAGHPGMPQECVKWENNSIHDNNNNIFTAANQSYCSKTPFVLRPRTRVCPQFQVPVGTGIFVAGGNRNLIANNHIYGNWRVGIMLIGVPAALRGDYDTSHQFDTSNGNRFITNVMGSDESAKRNPNGMDFIWDEQGYGNCFDGNLTTSRTQPASLPTCPGNPLMQVANLAVLGPMIACAAWDPNKLQNPPACDWFTTPAKP